MDFYESLYKYELEIQEKISARLNAFLQKINNSTGQIIEYQKSANNNPNFLNNINQLIFEINQSNAFKSNIINIHKKINQNRNKQKSINKDHIYAKTISECNEKYSIDNNNNKNNFNQKFIIPIFPDKNNYNKKLISDINKLVCDSITQNVKNKYLIEINTKNFNNNDTSSNYSSFRERCCSENSTKRNQKETDEIKNITTYQYIQNNKNSIINNNRFKNKLSVQMKLINNFTKNPEINNKLNSESPLMRNLINISGNNIKIKQKTTNINHNNRVNNNLSNFSGNLKHLKEYNANNPIINDELLINNNQEIFSNKILQSNRNSIKFNELKRRNKDTQIQINNNIVYMNKHQKTFSTNKNNLGRFKNKKIFERGQKILIKNIKLNNPTTNREQTQTYKNMHIKKPLFFQKIGSNNDSSSNIISNNQKSKKRICISPNDVSRNKNDNLIKFKIQNNNNLNLDINSEINNLILAEEKSERNKNKNLKTYTENQDLNNNDIISKKRFLIRNRSKIDKGAETINFNMRKSHSKDVVVNFEVIKNLAENNNKINEIKENREKVFKNIRGETGNELEKRKRLYSVAGKRILSSKIHIRGREDNKFLFWN